MTGPALMHAATFVAAIVLGAVISVAIAVALAGCAPAGRRADDALAGAFAAEMIGCVDRARTREESRACRAAVEERFAPLIDGGADARGGAQ